MNAAHLHMLVNHVSLFGVFFGICALLVSGIRKNSDFLTAALVLFIVSGVFSWVASETGESAEDIVEQIPGVMENYIHAHEEAAEFANGFTIALAGFSFLYFVMSRRGSRLLSQGRVILLALAFLSVASLARTALLGGKIHHEEIRSGDPPSMEGHQHDHEHSHDHEEGEE